jgi:hypothetical protein
LKVLEKKDDCPAAYTRIIGGTFNTYILFDKALTGLPYRYARPLETFRCAALHFLMDGIKHASYLKLQHLDLSWPAQMSRFTPTPRCGVDPSLGSGV